MNKKLEYGTCQICGRRMSIIESGNIHGHKRQDDKGNNVTCSGSEHPPLERDRSAILDLVKKLDKDAGSALLMANMRTGKSVAHNKTKAKVIADKADYLLIRMLKIYRGANHE